MKKIMKIMLLLIMLVIFIMSLAMVSTAEGKAISYKSTKISAMPSKFADLNKRNENYQYKDSYLVLDNYDIYKYLGFTDKSKSFFNDNLLIINRILCSSSTRKSYTNTGVTINNGIINVSYKRTFGPVDTCDVNVFFDVIELKKSDVKGVDLTKEIVTTQTVHISFIPEDTQSPDTYNTEQLVYIDAEKLIQKPDKVEKVKVKPTKEKQLKVSWKNIKGVKYEVKYSLKKGMKNAKTKKNIKKNKVTLKRLKSGKKYYIKVRAYQKIGNKTYTGKWSKKVSKKVK